MTEHGVHGVPYFDLGVNYTIPRAYVGRYHLRTLEAWKKSSTRHDPRRSALRSGLWKVVDHGGLGRMTNSRGSEKSSTHNRTAFRLMTLSLPCLGLQSAFQLQDFARDPTRYHFINWEHSFEPTSTPSEPHCKLMTNVVWYGVSRTGTELHPSREINP